MPQNTFPEVINNLPLFAGLPVEERDRLLKDGKLRSIAQGEYLFRNGDSIKSFYIVCKGSMQLSRETPNGKEVTTEVSTRGSSIGKADIFKGFITYHRVSACALEDATVLEFPAEWLRKTASQNSTVALNILTALSHYVHMVEIEAEQKTTMSAAQRVGCFLQRLCVMHNLDPSGFDLPYGKALIASRLGMEPETLSRTLGTLKKHGVEVKDNFVRFKDIDAIDEFVCSHCSLIDDCSTQQAMSQKKNERLPKR